MRRQIVPRVMLWMAVAGFGPGIRTAHAQFTATAADSLVAQLDSSDWRVRANALFDLGFFPDSLIPSTFSQKGTLAAGTGRPIPGGHYRHSR